ncbi:MAG: YihY family inner membrane protein [Hyphomicrobiales bacterium]|nr:YihY family inner membrane protein [Hyphomicrobiales bacterium]MCP5372552.1 YihY family inner membrane protein [Hyphomicrobiales bacterium]
MSINPKYSWPNTKVFLTRTVWEMDLSLVPWWNAWPLHLLRIVLAVGRDLADGQLNLRAMSLVYTTLLSLVPLLAISFSVLKGFGVHNRVEPFLLEMLAPLGDKSLEITNQIIAFVENIKVGVLGAIGLAFLIFTVLSMMQKIEGAFNHIWQVTQDRTFTQRFSGYLSVLIVGPLLVLASASATTVARSHEAVLFLTQIWGVGSVVAWVGVVLPYLLIVAAFTFIYVFMPNTRVHMSSAIVGALVAGFLWKVVGWIFSSFVVSSTNYTAVYSGFATLILFIIWLYVGWLILLVGASISFYHQNPEYLATRRGPLRLGNAFKEKMGLLVMYLVGHNYYRDGPAWTMEALSHRLRVPGTALEVVILALEGAGLLKRTKDEPTTFLPGRPMEATTVKEVLDAVRMADANANLSVGILPREAGVEDVVGRIDRALEDALAGRTLKDLALSGPAAAEALPEDGAEDAAA